MVRIKSDNTCISRTSNVHRIVSTCFFVSLSFSIPIVCRRFDRTNFFFLPLIHFKASVVSLGEATIWWKPLARELIRKEVACDQNSWLSLGIAFCFTVKRPDALKISLTIKGNSLKRSSLSRFCKFKGVHAIFQVFKTSRQRQARHQKDNLNLKNDVKKKLVFKIPPSNRGNYLNWSSLSRISAFTKALKFRNEKNRDHSGTSNEGGGDQRRSDNSIASRKRLKSPAWPTCPLALIDKRCSD